MPPFLPKLIAATAATALAAQAPRPELIDPSTDRVIQSGLRYLVRHQRTDGAWFSNGTHGGHPTAMTALAGMALLGSGSTPTRGRYWLAVRRATDFLIRTARPDGLIADIEIERIPMHGHGFATMFLAQVYGMEEDARRQQVIHDILTRAVALTARAQSAAGGWLYRPDSQGDEGSVTVTQIQALRACRNAGIAIPSQTIERAVRYISNSANPDGGIRYSAASNGPSRAPITAAAVAVLYGAGRYDDPMAARALGYAKNTLSIGRVDRHHFYAHLYLSQALYHQSGDAWKTYYGEASSWLGSNQRADGSWLGESVGPVYGTAIALTILQLPLASVPIYQR